MAAKVKQWTEPDTIPGTVPPSEYLQRLASDGVLDEIDRLHDLAELGEYESTEPMAARDFTAEVRRRDAGR